MKKIILFIVLWFVGCVSMPDGMEPVDNFQVERYMGKWYEIARLDKNIINRLISRASSLGFDTSKLIF